MSGIIDAFKEIYTGEDALVKHISIFTLCAIIGVAFTAALTGLPKGSASTEIAKNMFSLNPVFIILFILSLVLLYAYWLMFTHNSLNKFSNLEETPLLPYIDSNLATPAITAVPLFIVWTLYNILGSIIPIFNIFWSIVIQPFCVPYVFIAYCKDFSTKELFAPKFVFDVLPKVFLPTLILYFKLTLLSIIIVIPIFTISYLVSLLSSKFEMIVLLSLVTYLYYIISLSYTYCQAYIYTENVYEVNFDKNAY